MGWGWEKVKKGIAGNIIVKKKLIIVFHDNFRLFYKTHSHN